MCVTVVKVDIGSPPYKATFGRNNTTHACIVLSSANGIRTKPPTHTMRGLCTLSRNSGTIFRDKA